MKFDEYNYQNPTTDPQAQQTNNAGIDANMISTIGTTIAASVAQVLTDDKKKDTFATKRSFTMNKLMGSYSVSYTHLTLPTTAIV